MMAVENGLSILFTDREFLAYLDHKAKGGTRTGDEFGVEMALCIGDISNLTPQTASILAAAIRAKAAGDRVDGPLVIAAQRVEDALSFGQIPVAQEQDKAA